jgi:lipoate-protein ligase A
MQMALDVWLLDQVIAGQRCGPLLRFYRWARPTLSLGRHQRVLDPRWCRLVAADQLALVRRPSGGSAVLHGGDLTYALIWPDPPRQRREAYRLSCRWLQEAFAAMGLPLRFGDAPCRADEPNCFASLTTADLVHPGGAKRVGSAQLWKNRCLLQHGSVALNDQSQLWQAVFDSPAPSLPRLPLTAHKLEDHFLRHAADTFLAPPTLANHATDARRGVGPQELQSWEWRAVAAQSHRYEVRASEAGSGAASASMARASGSSTNPMG